MKKIVYIILDAANDIKYYQKFRSSLQFNNDDYEFIDGVEYYKELDKIQDDILKSKLYGSIDKADAVVVLLTKTLKSMRRFSKWQIEYAIKSLKPLIAVNPNRIRSVDYDVCPTILKSSLSLHIPYNDKALELALINWPQSHAQHIKNEKELKKTYKYAENIYQQILTEEE